jgi:sulfur carrier protein
MVSISLNGAMYVCRSASPRVADLVRELSLDGKRVAVEQNGQIVPRSRHAETAVSAGDRIEVVSAIGGG